MSANSGNVTATPVKSGKIASGDSVTVRVIDSFEQLQMISEEWNALLINSLSKTIFLTWEWLYAWAKCFLDGERTLFTLCIYQSGQLVGIAPFYLQKRRRKLLALREIRFLGTPEAGSDYLDMISQKGKEKVVAEALYNFLFGMGRAHWDELRLTDVPAESLFLLFFMNCVEVHGKFSEVQRCAVMPQTRLPSNVDAFFAMLSAKRRSRYRQDIRRLFDGGESEHVTFGGAELEEGLNRFFELYNTKSGYDGTKLHIFLSRLGTINTAKQWLQIDLLCTRSTDIAGFLHLRNDSTQSLLLMVVDKSFNRKISAGNVFVGMCLQKAIKDSVHIYDFLKGEEDYKLHWATDIRPSLTIILNQRHLVAILSTIGRLTRYALKAIIR